MIVNPRLCQSRTAAVLVSTTALNWMPRNPVCRHHSTTCRPRRRPTPRPCACGATMKLPVAMCDPRPGARAATAGTTSAQARQNRVAGRIKGRRCRRRALMGVRRWALTATAVAAVAAGYAVAPYADASHVRPAMVLGNVPTSDTALAGAVVVGPGGAVTGYDTKVVVITQGT